MSRHALKIFKVFLTVFWRYGEKFKNTSNVTDDDSDLCKDKNPGIPNTLEGKPIIIWQANDARLLICLTIFWTLRLIVLKLWILFSYCWFLIHSTICHKFTIFHTAKQSLEDFGFRKSSKVLQNLRKTSVIRCA